VARAEAIGGRSVLTVPGGGTIEAFGLQVDLGGYKATYGGRPLTLTASQIEVLAILLANRLRVCSRRELSQTLGLYGARTIDVMLSNIRSQVGVDFIKNVYNMGWIIDPARLLPDPDR